jgi:predicted dehydrogenase
VVETTANALAQTYGVSHVFSDFQTMLQSGHVNAVYLAVPHHLHDMMIRQAVEQGLPVLCEKPITESADSARELCEWVSRRSVKVGINYQRRYDSDLFDLVNGIQAGQIGSVRYTRINVPWEREWDYFENSAWHQKKAKAGGGTLITQASHYLDIVLQAMLPDKVQDVVAFVDRLKFPGRIEVEDFAMGILRTQAGRYIELCSSMITHPQQAVRIEVYGEAGTVIFEDGKRSLEWSGCEIIPRPSQTGGPHDSMARSLAGFRDWVTDEKPYRIPLQSALAVLECIDALYRSSDQGRIMPVC